jgi:hypothetical protein
MFPPKSLALNPGFWLKNPVSQPKSVFSAAMSRIHPDNLTENWGASPVLLGRL